MRLLIIGDVHGDLALVRRHLKVPADHIILLGDVSAADRMRALQFGKLKPTKQNVARAEKAVLKDTEAVFRLCTKKAPTALISGNMENIAPERWTNIKALAKKFGVRILDYRVARFGKLRTISIPYFRDASWAKQFYPKQPDYALSAQRHTEKVERVLAKAGACDVLFSHIPPRGMLDTVKSTSVPKSWQGKHAGSASLEKYVKTHKPRFVFCGHIHEEAGVVKKAKTTVHNLGDGSAFLLEC